MNKKQIGRAAILAAMGQCVVPAFAQEAGMVFHLGIAERLSHGTNLALETPAEDSTTLATTLLNFNMLSQTRAQTFAFDLSTGFEGGSEPIIGNHTGLADSAAKLAYSRESANSSIELGAFYRRNRVDFLQDLNSILGDLGAIDLPDDLGDLAGTGWRNRFGADARLEMGTNAPLGLILSAGINGTTYSDTSDPDLTNSQRKKFDAVLRARLSEVAEGTLSFGYSLYDADDLEQTRRETNTVEAGLTYALSERATLTAGLGRAVIDTRDTGITTREEGPTARLGLDFAMPNGSVGADFVVVTDQNGRRSTVMVNRALELPTGALSTELGVSKGESFDAVLVGALDWRQDLPRGKFTARAERKAKSDDADQAISTALILNYGHDLTEDSALQFGLSYAQIDKTSGNQVDRANFSASYIRELTADWDMTMGLAWKMRDEDTVGRATSEEVFFSLSRDFDWTR